MLTLVQPLRLADTFHLSYIKVAVVQELMPIDPFPL